MRRALLLPLSMLVVACSDGMTSDDDCSLAGVSAVQPRPPACPAPPSVDVDGGNIILEQIHFDTELQSPPFSFPPTEGRVIAYFMNRHTPGINPLPIPGQCNNLEATKGWPLYVVPTSADREDLDIGALTIIGKNNADASVMIDVPKLPPGRDQLGRPHDVYYQVTKPIAAAFLKSDSTYTVKLGGAGIVPPTTFDNALVLTTDFMVTMPMIDGDGPLIPGQELTVKWLPATSSNLPPNTDLLGVVWLLDTMGAPTHLCPIPHSAGQFTITGAAITEYKTLAATRGLPTNKVILMRSALVHKLFPLPNGDPRNPRRIDMLGMMSWAQLMNVN
jgi:hypothetical protein